MRNGRPAPRHWRLTSPQRRWASPTSFTAMIESCVNGSVEVLQHRLRKMLMEERYHFLHGRSWLKSGINAEPLNRAWREAIEWFGPPDGEVALLHREGKLSLGPHELHARLEERL